jgi:hypothetical protein
MAFVAKTKQKPSDTNHGLSHPFNFGLERLFGVICSIGTWTDVHISAS